MIISTTKLLTPVGLRESTHYHRCCPKPMERRNIQTTKPTGVLF